MRRPSLFVPAVPPQHAEEMLWRRRQLCFFAERSTTPTMRRRCGTKKRSTASMHRRTHRGRSGRPPRAMQRGRSGDAVGAFATHALRDDEAALRGGEVTGSPFVLAANDDGDAAATLAGNDGTEEAHVRAVLRVPPSVPVVITVERELEVSSTGPAMQPMTSTLAA
ncbi:hypothetical protein MRX96_036291 [Rhipicephalus microplus]